MAIVSCFSRTVLRNLALAHVELLSVSPRAYFLIWLGWLTYRCCCHTTAVLRREQGHIANCLYLPPPHLKTAGILCILKPHLCIFPWIWPTRISLLHNYKWCLSPWVPQAKLFSGRKCGTEGTAWMQSSSCSPSKWKFTQLFCTF